MVLQGSSQKKCSVGLALNVDCHKLTYSRKCGFLRAEDMSENEQNLLNWRANYISFDDDANICFHHEKIYQSRYEALQKYCCDPFQCHKKHIQSK